MAVYISRQTMCTLFLLHLATDVAHYNLKESYDAFFMLSRANHNIRGLWW